MAEKGLSTFSAKQYELFERGVKPCFVYRILNMREEYVESMYIRYRRGRG